jgi:hypothetical protein
VRRLKDFQDIALILEGHRAAAVVVATAGDHVWLEPHGDAQLVHANLPAPADLAFPHRSQFVMLSGRAERHASGAIQFRSEGQAHLRNLREAARLPIALPVHLEGPTSMTGRSTDLGRGGLHVDVRWPGAVDDEVAVRIEMPDDLPDVPTRASIVRTDARGVALAFVDLAPEQADRLENIVIAVRRRIAQRRIKAAAQDRHATTAPSPGTPASAARAAP